MCGRMTLTRRDLDEVVDELEAVYCPGTAAPAFAYRPRFNVAPTDRHPLLRQGGADGQRQLLPATWGLGAAGKGPLLINARAETAAVKYPFRDSFAHRRCVIPADGFIEWSGQGPQKCPFWLHAPDRSLLLFAGLYDQLPGGELRFTILTTAANGVVGALHDRMPAILAGEAVARWLRDGLSALLQPAPEAALVATGVSRRVNSVKNDDPACLLPEAEGTHPQDRQQRLFPL